MTVTDARFVEGMMIVATIDGREWHIPDNMANGHRQMVAQWEAAGNVIEALEEESQS
ncbi:hypothetical protein [uncultured Cohaesibacter sp.]|uniref:hypothetical protein n=1 Tax=uncultured Cohaesibacter sp. TaxID=1002546 RepID=UPI0029C784BC|nr:hypothetical protein [uncultured Cohaesibacter sp.]